MKFYFYATEKDEHKDTFKDYTHICLANQDINEFIDDAEATEIIVSNVLEYVPLGKITIMLDLIISKIHKEGKIIITGTDAYAVAKDFANYIITVEDFNILLNGTQENEKEVKTAVMNMSNLVTYLQGKGFKIIKQRLEDYTYAIEAIRQ